MVNKEIKIRPLQETDFKTVIMLDNLTLQGNWNLAQYQRELHLPNSQFWLLCLVDTHTTREDIIGMGCWRAIAQDAEIPIFAIHPHHQNEGLGKFFFSWLLTNMVNYNVHCGRLEVKVSNQKAIALYKKFGFQIITKLTNYYPLTHEDGYRMMSGNLRSESFRQKLALCLKQFSLHLEAKNLLTNT